MKILVLNCGSSSVKFQLFDMTDETPLAKGVVEKIGSSDAIITYQPKDKNKLREIREVLNHGVAIEMVLSMLLHPQHGVIQDIEEIDGIGHRVVHGGEEFSSSVIVREDVKSAIDRCIQFAPLHNPHNLKGIEACEKLLSGVPQVAVFDTAFHHTIPAHAYLYGLPYALYKKLGIRRYGFHGTSHRYVAVKAAEYLKKPLESLKLITCHLGNGASITAVDGGNSVDTSMGFTPLEGLVMGTRCGDIDPALVPFIMGKEKLSAKEIDTIMNKNSGMLGLTGTSNDMREIEAEAARGNKQHRMALDIYCYRVKKYIGSYFAAIGGADAIIFTGGIGENSAFVRGHSLAGMERLGVVVNDEKNVTNQTSIGDGSVEVLIIPTNEELAIARDAMQLFSESIADRVSEEGEAAGEAKLVKLDRKEKAELVLMWAEDPEMKPEELTVKFGEQIGQEVPLDLVCKELDRMGLNTGGR